MYTAGDAASRWAIYERSDSLDSFEEMRRAMASSSDEASDADSGAGDADGAGGANGEQSSLRQMLGDFGFGSE